MQQERLRILEAEMVKMHLIFSASQTATKEEITAKAVLYSEDLEEIPTNYLERVFKLARKKSKTFPKPQFIIELWKDIEFDDVPRIPEKTSFSGTDYPTEKQHVAYMKLIKKVLSNKEIDLEKLAEYKKIMHSVLYGGDITADMVLAKL